VPADYIVRFSVELKQPCDVVAEGSTAMPPVALTQMLVALSARVVMPKTTHAAWLPGRRSIEILRRFVSNSPADE